MWFHIYGMLHCDCLPKYNIVTIWKDKLSQCENASVVIRRLAVEPSKFSKFILYTRQNMFSPYVCCAWMCSDEARGFDGQNLPGIYTTCQLEKEEKKSQISALFKI